MIGKIYFGLHMAEGICEYKEKQVNTSQPYRVFLNDDTVKKMNATFTGKPLYINHVDDVDVEKIPAESVGYVVESFYNKADGKNWVKFIVTKEEGEAQLQKGWKLSNAYISKAFGGGGVWHGVDYLKEVLDAEYEHLAIVQSPRYKESIVLTPEEFKKYNSDKELKLLNSEPKTKQKEKTMKFNFFKKEKMENSADLESMSVILPRSKKEFTIEKMINEFDEQQMNSYVNGDGKVKVGESEMSVNELVEKYNTMCKNSDEAAKKDEELKKNAADEELKKNSMTEEEKKKNAADEEEKLKMNSMSPEEKAKYEEEKKKNSDEAAKKAADEKAQNSAHFEKLKNAAAGASDQSRVVETSEDRVARGNSRYGSK